MSSTRQCYCWSDSIGGQGTPQPGHPHSLGQGTSWPSPCLLDEKVFLFMQLVHLAQVPAQQETHFFLGSQPLLLLVLALLYSWT